jgi:beta-galactosidase GanA
MLTWRTTPYLAELHRTYEASQYLDAKVTFVTERQVRNGRLSRYKVLLVPGARNVPREVAGAIWEYAAAGGRVVIVPESLLGDEYNRKQNYLARLAISIRETRRPKLAGQGRMLQGYDQSFSQDIQFASDTPEKLKGTPGPIGEIEVRGVRQSIETSGAAEALFRYPDGSPAIVRVRLGKGAVDYVAGTLEEQSYAGLLDVVFGEAGVSRPVRVRALNGAGKGKVEARFTRSGTRKLLYVVNFNAQPVQLIVDAPSVLSGSLHELREQRVIAGRQIQVPARQSAIYEIF